MTIFVDPDELKSSSLFPQLDTIKECPGLEALTGADFAISRLPILIKESTLQLHIERRTLFVQRKSGYDILSFDNLKHAIARMKACSIPQQQSILLFIGKDWQDDNGLLRVEGSKPYGDTTYETFIKLKAKWRFRGGVVDWINNPEQLQLWIEAQENALLDVESEGKREIYPDRQLPELEPDDIWQPVEEIDRGDIRYLMCAGLYGFGPKLANSVLDYANENGLSSLGIYYFKLLTDENEKGKAVYNVKGWGNKSRGNLRQMLALPKGVNIGFEHLDSDEGKQWCKGWIAALESFRQMIDNGHKPVDAWQGLMKQCNELVNLEGFFKGK